MTTHLRIPQLLLAAAVALALTAAALALPRESAHAEGTASIVGFVAQNRADSQDAHVYVYRENPESAYGRDLISWASVDEDGNFAVRNLEPGTYKVYFDLWYSQLEGWWQDGDLIADATPVTLADGEEKVLNPVGLLPYAQIKGRITSTASGQPVEGVGISPWLAYVGGFGATDTGAGTQADGTYTLRVPGGTYRLRFKPPSSSLLTTEYWDNAPTIEAGTSISVVRGDVVTGIDAALAAEPPLKNLGRPVVNRNINPNEQVINHTYGTWSIDRMQLQFAVQWFRNGTAIPGAVNHWYPIKESDFGHRLAVRVTATRTGTTPVAAMSDPVVFLHSFKLTSAPALLGKLKVGKVLRAVAPRSTPAGAVSFQWLRNGRAIGGAAAKKASYKLVRADRRKRIGVRITLRRLGYTTVVRTVVRPAKVR